MAEHILSPRLRILMGVAAGLVITALCGRTFAHPLAGYDTPWRWDHLARMILRHGSIDFYPPMTAEDYRIYPYADGIAPLVAGIYWALYRVTGSENAAVTSVAVVAQIVGCLGLVFSASRRLYGRDGAWLSASLLALTPLWCRGVAIGQETGFTAIAVAGQIAFVVAARERFPTARMLAAGLFAGIGGLAREYGVAFSAVGLTLALASPATRGRIPLFIGVLLAVAAPWYVRNWWICGNPLFGMPSPLGPPANPVHAAIMRHYAEGYALKAAPRERIGEMVREFTTGGLPLLLCGIWAAWRQMPQQWPLAGWGKTACSIAWMRSRQPGCLENRRFSCLEKVPEDFFQGQLVLGAGISCGLWLWSVQYTAGGIPYSMRTLTPFWVCLAVLAGSLAAPLGRSLRAAGPWRSGGMAVVFAAWAGWCLASAAAFPWPANRVATAWRQVSLVPIDRAIPPQLFAALESSPAPALGILTDDPYFAAALIQRNSRFNPIMVWNPAVAPLFDPRMSAADCNRLLGRLRTPLAYPLREFQNWPFLMRHRFFREEERSWQRWIGAGHRGVEIMPHVAPPSAIGRPTQPIDGV
jgi:hypothetical protein